MHLRGTGTNHAAVRAAGLSVLGGKRLINLVLYNCVTCQKLRGKAEEQHMADLPSNVFRYVPHLYVGYVYM